MKYFLLISFLFLIACNNNDIQANRIAENSMKIEELLDSNSEWDAKETIAVYENYNSANNEESLASKANKGHLGAQLVALKLRQDNEMESNLPVNLNINEFYDLGIKGQPLAASYAATSIHDVDSVKRLENLVEVIEIQKKLIETGIKGGVLANFPFYLSLLLLNEDEASKIDNNWFIDKKTIRKLNNIELNNLLNISKYLVEKGYVISPIYLTQMYYFGYGVKADKVEACAWSNAIDISMVDQKIIQLISKIQSEKMSTEDEKKCQIKAKTYKQTLKYNYDNWLENESIVSSSSAKTILSENNILFN